MIQYFLQWLKKRDHLLFWSGLIFALYSVLITGYTVHVGNHPFQIPLVDLLNHTALYPNDYLVATLPYYCSLLWRGVAYLNRLFSLEQILLAGFIVERLLLMFGASKLALSFFPGSRLAAIGAMAAFTFPMNPILGGGTIVADYFEQTAFFTPFFLLAAAAFNNRKKISWAILMGIGFNLNSMYGTFALTYFGAAFLFDRNYRSLWKEWMIPGVLFFVIASPAILLSAEAISKSGFDRQLWMESSQFVLSRHLFPLTWPAAAFWRFGILVAAVWLLRGSFSSLWKQGIVWTCVCCSWVVLAFFAAYSVASPELLVTHPARATDLWYCFIIVALVSHFANKLETLEHGRFLWGMGFAVSIVFMTPLSDAQLLGFILVIAFAFAYAKWLSKGESIVVRSALMLLLLVGPFSLWSYQQRSEKSHPDNEMIDVAQWARENTSHDSVFFVNPLWESFREISKRPVFVTIKDGSAILWYRPVVTEWAKRIRLAGIDPDPRKKNYRHPDQDAIKHTKTYQSLTDNEVQDRILGAYRVDYWVVPSNNESGFPSVYSNAKYKVLDVRKAGYLMSQTEHSKL